MIRCWNSNQKVRPKAAEIYKNDLVTAICDDPDPSETSNQFDLAEEIIQSLSNNFFQYFDGNAAVAASFAAAAQQTVAEGANFSNAPIVYQGQQISSNIPAVDPRFPELVQMFQRCKALSNAANSISIDPNRNTSSMLTINTTGLNVSVSVSVNETPMSHYLNSHFMVAAQSINNGCSDLIAPTQRGSVNNRRNV
ncbi:hypothetical protein Glove_74g330 [Diversispora epigaea]|uniref:Uncharacterized protein n=1 Tax=Diversispora epigaea TaxID=1348612 RepID=A0A397JA93_9GLOM|nr:hypothetical protein Glove_74g330 [Diversispora epigaea]